ncbi:MAG TPA: hypothetical protein VMT91_00175 [Anaerolineales bacterium]|nr:hypothetical protein [Anaerolineales bacterium]
MFLDNLKLVLDIVAAITVIAGVIIALLQFRDQNHLRQIDTIFRIYSQFGQESFARHFRLVTRWNYETYAEFLEKSPMDEDISLIVVSTLYEHMGLLLKRKYASIGLLNDLLGDTVLMVWAKVEPIWLGFRKKYNEPEMAIWFEYLHDAIVQYKAKIKDKPV